MAPLERLAAASQGVDDSYSVSLDAEDQDILTGAKPAPVFVHPNVVRMQPRQNGLDIPAQAFLGVGTAPVQPAVAPIPAGEAPVQPVAVSMPAGGSLGQTTQRLEQEIDQLERNFKDVNDKKGWIGSTWDFVKNTIGASSEDKAWYDPRKWWGWVVSSDHGSGASQKAITQAKQQLAELKELARNGDQAGFNRAYQQMTGKAYDPNQVQNPTEGLLGHSKLAERVEGFKSSQENGVDVISDIVTGVVSYAAYTVAAAGLAAAPFTGGASLLVTAGALGVAMGVGAVTKMTLKASDAWTGGRSYESAGYDAATGAFSGLLAPLSAGGGSAVAGTVARRLGIETVTHSAEQLIVQGAKRGLTTELTLQGGTMLSRLGVRTVQTMADGAIAGSFDNSFRHIYRTGSLDGAGEAFLEGGLGGMILSPVISGGMLSATYVTGAAMRRVFPRVASEVHTPTVHESPTVHGTPEPPGGDLGFLVLPVLKMADDPGAALGVARRVSQDGTNPSMLALAADKAPRAAELMHDPSFRSAEESVRLKRAIDETRSVGPGKLLQILADDASIPDNIRRAGELLKKDGKPSRTVPKAQELADQLYGKGQYHVDDMISAGTVGETYFARRASDGRRVVLKMIKEGVSPESLEKERLALHEYIRSEYTDPKAQRYYSTLVDSMYRGWADELNFMGEAVGAHYLGQGAQRFRVTKALDVGYNQAMRGVSMVYEVAQGLSMKDVMKMLKAFKESPEAYQQHYAKQIAEHPWLANPQQWMHELPEVFLRAQNEQSLLTSASGLRTSHGDPHAGNIFVNHNGRHLELNYIDAGLTLTRSGSQVVDHLGTFLSLITHNPKRLAKQLIDHAELLPEGVSRQTLIEQLTKQLEERIYGAGRNKYTDVEFIQQQISRTLREMGIIQNSADSIFVKSQMQTMLGYKALSRLADQEGGDVIRRSFGDIASGLFKSAYHNPRETLGAMGEAFIHFLAHPIDSVRTFWHFYKS